MSTDPRVYGRDLAISIARNDFIKSPQGGLATVTDAELVAQALRLCLYTQQGDLILHPEWGNSAYDLISEPITGSWYDRVRAACLAAVDDEPRAQILGIEVAAIPTEGRGVVTVAWQLLKEVDTERSLNWEFNLGAVLASIGGSA